MVLMIVRVRSTKVSGGTGRGRDAVAADPEARSSDRQFACTSARSHSRCGRHRPRPAYGSMSISPKATSAGDTSRPSSGVMANSNETDNPDLPDKASSALSRIRARSLRSEGSRA
jgi:hypothetical protein